MRSRIKAEAPAGKNSFSPSTANFPGFATRQASSHRMPKVSAASMEPCSLLFTPARQKQIALCVTSLARTQAQKIAPNHRRAQPVHGKARKAARQHPLQHLLVRHARGAFCSGRSTVAFAANLKLGWFRLSKPLHCQPEDFVLNLCFQNPPHEITFLRPQMQQALVPLTGNGVRRLSQIEDNGTVFDDYCIA